MNLLKYSKISIQAVVGTVFDFYLLDDLADSASYILKNVDGLGPPDPGLSMANGSADINTYQGAHPLPRQLVLTIGFQPDYISGQTVGDLRQALYALLDSRNGTPLAISLKNSAGAVIATTSGFVSKFEPDIFSIDPQVQITIDCTSPYLSGPSLISVPATAGVGFSVDYAGTAPAGFYAEWLYTGTVSASLFRAYNNGIIFAMTGTNMVNPGDLVTLSTIDGQLGVNIGPNGGTLVNRLALVLPSTTTTWWKLYPGANAISVYDQAHYNCQKFQYTPRYLGV